MVNVPAEEIASRIVALQALLQKESIDAAIIRQNADLFYFTGTVQDAHLIVPASSNPVFLVRRHIERALEQSPIRPIVQLQSIKTLPEAVKDACGVGTIKSIGFELDVLPTNTFFFYDEKVFPKQRIVDVSPLIRQVRMVKSDWEISMMRRAGEISKAVADAVPEFLRPGISEWDLSLELERVSRKAGHLGLIRLRGFNMDMYFGHVLSGPGAATPAYSDTPTGGRGVSSAFGQGASDHPIAPGELVSVDTMMNYQGYLNDQTRNFCMGDTPPKLAEAYRVSQEIHAFLRDSARPGTVTGEIYEASCRIADRAGLSDYFMGHGPTRVSFIGHGLGIEVDELPVIAPGQKLMLREGMTFAFEPKFIIPGLGIAGLENTYVVRKDGLESLNSAKEELILV